MIRVTAEKFTGGASTDECTFESIQAAENALSITFGCPGERVQLQPGEYIEIGDEEQIDAFVSQHELEQDQSDTYLGTGMTIDDRE